MKHFHGKYWKEYIEARVRPRFEHFGEITLTRILPPFDGINEEATALERRRYRELVSNLEDVPEDDMWDAGEAISDKVATRLRARARKRAADRRVAQAARRSARPEVTKAVLEAGPRLAGPMPDD